MQLKEKKQIAFVGLLLVVMTFVFFLFFYPYHLFFKEQVLLFLNTSDYFLSYFQKPGWLSCYSGDFLTQFFYLRGGGPLVLSLLFCLEWILVVLIIRRTVFVAWTPLWALIPVVIDWALHCSLLHWVSESIGFVLVLSLFLIYTFFTGLKVGRWYGLIVSIVGYWLIGSSSLVFPLLIGLFDWHKNRFNIWFLFLVTGIAWMMPLMLRSIYLLPLQDAYVYPSMNLKGVWVNIGLMIVLLAGITLKNISLSKPRSILVMCALIVLGILSGGVWVNADFTRERHLSYDSEIYFGNTNGVLELIKKQDLETRLASYFANLALAKQGELPERLMEFYQPAFYGLQLPVSPDESWTTILFSNEVFYLIGDMNLAQHSAMLGITFSPWQRGSRMIKRLAEINMVNNDSAAAGKYLRLLTKTTFHQQWAQNRLAINQGKNTARWLDEKRAQIPDADTLRKAGDYLASLQFLVSQKPSNLVALDYLLCYHLLNKDLKSFRDVYDRYPRLVNRPVPSVYAEALLIVIASSGITSQEATHYAIDRQKMTDFMNYTKLYEQTHGDMNALQQQFGKSYWFYYHYATMTTK